MVTFNICCILSNYSALQFIDAPVEEDYNVNLFRGKDNMSSLFSKINK